MYCGLYMVVPVVGLEPTKKLVFLRLTGIP